MDTTRVGERLNGEVTGMPPLQMLQETSVYWYGALVDNC